MRFRRSLLPVLGWCAATLASIVVASVAMMPVLRTAAPGDGSLVSADQIREDGPIPLPSVPTPSLGSPPSPSEQVTSPPRAPRSSSPSRKPASRSATPTPSRTTTEPVDEPTVEDGWTVTTGDNGERTYVRSFRVEGGHTVIRMTEKKVTLVTATPSDGYEVATVQNSPDNLAVYFNEVNHSFVIHALWHENKPFAQVSEIGG